MLNQAITCVFEQSLVYQSRNFMLKTPRSITITHETIAKALRISLRAVQQAEYRGDFRLDCPISISIYIVKTILNRTVYDLSSFNTNIEKPAEKPVKANKSLQKTDELDEDGTDFIDSLSVDIKDILKKVGAESDDNDVDF